VVIARAGALTISELASTGTASLLIPLPHAIDDHQTENARVLANAGAAVLVRQSDAHPDHVAAQLAAWIAEPSILASLSAAASQIASPEATHRVVEALKEVAYADG
jgi:UDP-N-acetylglucosamine--N-acetylmuramyl-(pentapeptide) pyrophosphoryl-undecaprenol N-acetylglucosamine transferase